MTGVVPQVFPGAAGWLGAALPSAAAGCSGGASAPSDGPAALINLVLFVCSSASSPTTRWLWEK